MLRSLGTLVSPPAVVVLVLAGTVSFVLAAATASPLMTFVGLGLGFLLALAALAMVFLVWLKRVNADIDSDRYDIQREIDEVLADEGETEED